jgi:hypothetical protein
MADITRWLAVRLNLLSISWSADSASRDFGVEGGSGFSTFEEAGLVLSPWRGKLKVQPYAFGGLGVSFVDHALRGIGVETRTVEVRGSYGVGVEPLLFFLPHAPALFLELGQVFGGGNMFVVGIPYEGGANWWWARLSNTRIAVGVRL